MTLAWLKRKIQACYLRGGLLVLAVCLLLASTSLAQLADTTIAFMSTRSGNGEIYLINPDGKRVRRLTRHPEYDSAPAWSPDGQKITFSSFRGLHRPEGIILAEIYLMNPDGANPINLTQSVERADGHSSWSPDGKQIAFTSAERFKWRGGYCLNIWVMDADGGHPRNLTNHDALDQTPDWSPDGRRIAFTSDRNRDWELGNDVMGNWEIYVMNADGTNPINLTNHPTVDRSPDWSPDGRQIAFTSDRDGNFEIYVMNADGPNPINLTNHPAWDSQPSWEPVPTLNVTSKGKLATSWGKVKHTR